MTGFTFRQFNSFFIKSKDSFSSIFFTKDKIGVMRNGNLVILKLEGEGIMGFDFNTGKKLFTMDI